MHLIANKNAFVITVKGVIIIGIFDWFKKNRAVTVSRYQMITDDGNGFYSWNGQLYKSDIVRSCIRPKARAIGKAVGKHIRKGLKDTQVNPDVYIRFLLEEPNPYMTGQQMQEKLITQLELNNNAFAYINRDPNGLPMEIYPITAITAEAVNSDNGILHLRFTLKNGQTVTFRYTDIIHLRKDYNDNEIFGDSPAETLAPLMEIVNTTDQGIVKAIKNSNVIKWLLKYNASLRPEDIKKQTKQFVDDYLSVESDSLVWLVWIPNSMPSRLNRRTMYPTKSKWIALYNVFMPFLTRMKRLYMVITVRTSGLATMKVLWNQILPS